VSSPGGTVEQGDFRDRLVRRFAAAVQERTGGELTFEIYPGSSLMRTVAQFSAMRRGALDMSLHPLAYAGDEAPEVDAGLLPCLVTTHEQGLAWKANGIGHELESLLDRRGIKVVTWIWQGGGVMSKLVFNSLTPDQQAAVVQAGLEQEAFALASAKAGDQALAEVYGKAGVPVADMDAAAIAQWKAVPQESAWKDFSACSASCAAPLKLAEAVP